MLKSPSIPDPAMPEVSVGGEYLVLVQPHLHHDGRRQWVVMAVYDHDERMLATGLAEAYRGRGHDVAVAQIVLEDDGYPYDNAVAKRH